MRSPLGRVLLVLSFFAAAVPFAFAVIRASTTGSDFRYLWMAIVALGGAVIVLMLRLRRSNSASWFGTAVVGFALATGLSGAVGYFVGARKSAAIWIVAIAFGGCEAAAVAFRLLAARHDRD